MIIWMTGLSGSGKTVYSNYLESKYGFICLDGDDLRKGLCSDLSFSDKDKVENGRRQIELCKLFDKKGLDVVVSTITAYNGGYDEKLKCMTGRRWVRKELPSSYICWVKCSVEKCKERDPKGLYKKQLNNFSGINSKWEDPDDYQILLDSENNTIEENYRVLDKFVSDSRS